MKHVSIFNEVIGPVMRGPSSSHTAASYHVGWLIRDLLGGTPMNVKISFAKGGSYAEVYHQQGSDLGFATGIMGKTLTDEGFQKALEQAENMNLDIKFAVKKFDDPVHPNTMEIIGRSKEGNQIKAMAKSIGGGAVEVNELNQWQVHVTGDSHELLVEIDNSVLEDIVRFITQTEGNLGDPIQQYQDERSLIIQRRKKPLENRILTQLKSWKGVHKVWTTTPFFYTPVGTLLFENGAEMIELAEKQNLSLGQIALAYETKLLGISDKEAIDEMYRRFTIMKSGVEKGLSLKKGMQLLMPSAEQIWKAEEKGKLAIGGLHTRAAVRALAVMHVNSSMGVVCAAPTGGSAGTLPGVITTLVEEKVLNKEKTALALFAGSAIGLILAMRGTFAAEVAGCQVEIGVAGAMGAAAVVEVAHGSARQAADAAAISFQNTMGSVCDLVQGIVEIPCHTRNAVAASSAFVCADLILGGYFNPIPLDETIDAVMSVGKMLPAELRCTARGGLAITPSAQAMKNIKES